jgi:hypothetical protein
MSVGSAAHVELARSRSETTRASRKIVPARIWGCIIAWAALSGCDAAPLDRTADGRSDEADSALAVGRRGNPGVVPPDGLPGGLSLAQWSVAWWQQILAIPSDRNPVFDKTGEDCAEGAGSDVWFLAGTAGGSVTRSCTIPTDTRILFPLVNTADDNNSPTCLPQPIDCSRSPSLEVCLTRDVHKLLKANTLFAVVDGVPLHKLFDFVQTSRLFFFIGDLSLMTDFDSCITGSPRPQPAVAYGWWIMLEPLSPGHHTLKFGGTGTFGDMPFAIDVTYHLDIRRPPG